MIKYQSDFGKLAIKFEIGLRLFLFFTSGTLNIWCISYSVYSVYSAGFKGREINKSIPDRKYIASYPSNQLEKVLPQISGLRICCPSRKFQD